MRLIKLIFPLALISLLCISFFSCSETENPVIPPIDTSYHFDSARYNWQKYSYSGDGFQKGVWARDTNDILAANFYGDFVRLKNGIFSPFHFTDFFTQYIGGFDNNTGYLIGVTRNQDSSMCRIKKWNGSSFEEISVANNRFTRIYNCFFYKPNEIWISGFNQKRIYKFDGTGLTEYNISLPNDSNCGIVKIYFDSLVQKVRTVVWINVNPLPGDIFTTYFLYDFDGNQWIKTGEINFPIQSPTYFIQYIEGSLLRRNTKVIELYNGSYFSQFLEAADFDFYSNSGGFSKVNFFAAGFNVNAPIGYAGYLYNWNGQKWSKELSHTFFYNVVTSINEKFCVIIDNDGINKESYFFIGTKN